LILRSATEHRPTRMASSCRCGW